jgi:hypothetical protein
MSDLSNLLGDVYGDHSPDAAPVRRELSADQRAPEWAAESQLDRAFDGWVPGEPPTAARPDDLTAALSAALAAPAPAPAAPVYETVPMPTIAAAAPAVEAPAAWTTSAAPAPAPAPAVVAAPATVAMWSPGDDDIFPMAKAGRKGKKK